jgi:hypothetical protein
MIRNEIVISGDTAGVEWRLPVLRFSGREPTAPRVYLQAALHASELPGIACLHQLIPLLEIEEKAGRLLGTITVVPAANPIGAAQWLHGELQGRFEIASRVNFNRDFPVLSLSDRHSLLEGIGELPAAEQLKRHLMHMALGADVVIDLHCDDESVLYAYIDRPFWPEAEDLATCLGLEAVLIADGTSSAFDESVSRAWKLDAGEGLSSLPGRLSVTMEYRGVLDVNTDTSTDDAARLLDFLRLRGVIDGRVNKQKYSGPVAELDHVEMIRATVSGAVVFLKKPGDHAAKGEPLARIIAEPGSPEKDAIVTAPQDGLVLTRVSVRFVRKGDDLIKLVGREKTKAIRPPGALEA